MLMKTLLVAVLAFIMVQPPAFAQGDQTTVFYPTDDAYVDMMATAVNYGSAQVLESSWSTVQGAGGAYKMQIDRLSYLKFSMVIPEGGIVRSAFLNIYVKDAVVNSSTLIALPEENNVWNETTITPRMLRTCQACKKDVEDNALHTLDITGLDTWYSLNVTSHARSVRSGLLSLKLIGGETEEPFLLPGII